MHRLPLLLPLLLLVACGSDNPTGPQVAPRTHDEIEIKMSSISATQDCDSGGNPGDYRVTLVVWKTFEDGTTHEIGRKTDTMEVADGNVVGSTMTPIRFEMPREPGARFTVEWWIGEYDTAGAADFEKHGYSSHRFDAVEGQDWGPNSGEFRSYTTLNDGDQVGVYKFTGWSEREGCRGFANYAVYFRSAPAE